MPQPYGDELREKARLVRATGLSYCAVGAMLGVSKTAVIRWVNPDRAEKHREDEKKWRDENRSEARDRANRSTAAHREEIRARHALKYARDRERHIAYSTSWAVRNPERRRENEAARRARKRGAVSARTTEEKKGIARVYEIAQSQSRVRCYLCGKWIPIGLRHVDHVIPLSRGGKHLASNLAVACARCNTSKYARLPEEVGLLV